MFLKCGPTPKRIAIFRAQQQLEIARRRLPLGERDVSALLFPTPRRADCRPIAQFPQPEVLSSFHYRAQQISENSHVLPIVSLAWQFSAGVARFLSSSSPLCPFENMKRSHTPTSLYEQ